MKTFCLLYCTMWGTSCARTQLVKNSKTNRNKIIYLKTYRKTSGHIPLNIPVRRLIVELFGTRRYVRKFSLNFAVRVCAKINLGNIILVNFKHFWTFTFQHTTHYTKGTSVISKNRDQRCGSEFPNYIFYFLLRIWILGCATYGPPCIRIAILKLWPADSWGSRSHYQGVCQILKKCLQNGLEDDDIHKLRHRNFKTFRPPLCHILSHCAG